MIKCVCARTRLSVEEEVVNSDTRFIPIVALCFQ